jgi:hypothetical protein
MRIELVLLGEGFRDAESTRIMYATSSRHLLPTELMLIKRRKLKKFSTPCFPYHTVFLPEFFLCLRGAGGGGVGEEEEEYNQSSFTFSNFYLSSYACQLMQQNVKGIRM